MTKKTCPIAILVLTVIALTLSLASTAVAQATEDVLYIFTGGQGDGGYPASGLTWDSSGNLYGVTSDWSLSSAGHVYKLTRDGNFWNYTSIYTLNASTDGADPYAALTIDSQGNLYGTCTGGGANNKGTVFELTNSGGTWSVSRRYSFTGGADGAIPWGNVILDPQGNVYTTSVGQDTRSDYGAVIELTPNGNGWTEQTLHTFTGGNDGAYPFAGLIMDRAGNLYGTTEEGGSNGDGVVFKLHNTGSGWIETTLYAFTGAANDGAYPTAGLTFDSVGRIYGTTTYTNTGFTGNGGVFQLAPAPTAPRSVNQPWQITWLHQFNGQDGENPLGGVTFDSSGNLYGTTYNAEAFGNVYKLTPSPWTESVLWTFTGNGTGAHPSYVTLIQDSAGNIYGTTMNSGSAGQYPPYGGPGVVFELTQ